MTVLTAIISICEMLKAIFAFLGTTEGQVFCREYRENRDKVHAAVAAAWADLKDKVLQWPSLWETQPSDIKKWWERIIAA